MSKAKKLLLPTMNNKAVVRVLGCKVNQAESAAMGKILEELGYVLDSEAEDPALVVVNTCCVTSRAEAKSRRMVGRLASRFPSAKLVVTGCLAEVNPSSLEEVARDSVILGTYAKDRFRHFVTESYWQGIAAQRQRASSCTKFGDLGASGTVERARAFLKVQDGCSQHCTYCIVPRARGPARSLEPSTALAHARGLCDDGYAEIVLTGVHLGSYGKDLDPQTDLASLIEALLSHCPTVRLRLSSIEPQEVTENLVRLIATHPRVCRHLHIPVQSGDDGVLDRMKRPYRVDTIRQLTNDILSEVPEASIGMDIMAGFPGESDHAFQRTISLVRSCGAAYLHVFPFSARPGAPAARYQPPVSADVAQQRVEELRAVSRELRQRFYARFLGQTLEAVVESELDVSSRSFMVRTDNYVPVRVEAHGPLPDFRVLPVTLLHIAGDEVIGVSTL
jgi:threonylcarbamoyladenosine tRNA methylthiotransferase MtaB